MKMEFNVKVLADVVKGGLVYYHEIFYIKGELVDNDYYTCYSLGMQRTCTLYEGSKVIDTGLVVGKLDKEEK